MNIQIAFVSLAAPLIVIGSMMGLALAQADRAVSRPQAAAQPSKATRWTRDHTSRSQIIIGVISKDGRFGLNISCLRTHKGALYYTDNFAAPAGWMLASGTPLVTIDGAATGLLVDGADEFLVLSDTRVDDHVALSEVALSRIGAGSRLLIPGAHRKGKAWDAVIDIGGGQKIFGDFQRDCSRLLR